MIVIFSKPVAGVVAGLDGRIEEDIAIRKVENFKVADPVDTVGLAQRGGGGAAAAGRDNRRMGDRDEAVAIAVADRPVNADAISIV